MNSRFSEIHTLPCEIVPQEPNKQAKTPNQTNKKIPLCVLVTVGPFIHKVVDAGAMAPFHLL